MPFLRRHAIRPGPQHHRQQQRRGGDQARAQGAEHDLQIPGLDLGAPVEVQAEARAHVERLHHADRRPRQRIPPQLQPCRPFRGQHAERRLHAVRQQVLRQVHHHRGHAAQQQCGFEVQAHQRQQDGRAVGLPGQYPATLAQAFALHPLQQVDRQVQRAHRRQPPPRQQVRQRAHAPRRLRAQRLARARHAAEHRARDDVQRDAVEGRLQPPHERGRQPELVDPPRTEIQQREHRQRQPPPGLPDGACMPAHQRHAQLHGLPVRTRAQPDGQLLNPHRPPRVRRNPATPPPASTARPTRCTSPPREWTASTTRTPR